jgi:hypothetical protein
MINKMFLQAATWASKVLKLMDETGQLFKTIVSIFSLSAIKLELFLLCFFSTKLFELFKN